MIKGNNNTPKPIRGDYGASQKEYKAALRIKNREERRALDAISMQQPMEEDDIITYFEDDVEEQQGSPRPEPSLGRIESLLTRVLSELQELKVGQQKCQCTQASFSTTLTKMSVGLEKVALQMRGLSGIVEEVSNGFNKGVDEGIVKFPLTTKEQLEELIQKMEVGDLKHYLRMAFRDPPPREESKRAKMFRKYFCGSALTAYSSKSCQGKFRVFTECPIIDAMRYMWTRDPNVLTVHEFDEMFRTMIEREKNRIRASEHRKKQELEAAMGKKVQLEVVYVNDPFAAAAEEEVAMGTSTTQN